MSGMPENVIRCCVLRWWERVQNTPMSKNTAKAMIHLRKSSDQEILQVMYKMSGQNWLNKYLMLFYVHNRPINSYI